MSASNQSTPFSEAVRYIQRIAAGERLGELISDAEAYADKWGCGEPAALLAVLVKWMERDATTPLSKIWRRTLGPGFANMGEPVEVNDGHLVVRTEHSQQAHQLSFMEPEIVKAFAAFGVQHLRFRVSAIKTSENAGNSACDLAGTGPGGNTSLADRGSDESADGFHAHMRRLENTRGRGEACEHGPVCCRQCLELRFR